MKKFVLLQTFLFCSYLLFAQQTYTVKVTDSNTGEPLSSVSAKIKSSKKGISAAADGIVKIQANANDVLEISSVGYITQSIVLKNETTIQVAMAASLMELGDVAGVGDGRIVPRV